jgi:HK97 family phage portal protein
MTMLPWPLPGGYSATGFPRRYFADGGEVLYLKDRSDDGILGRSRLSRAPGAVACGIGAQGFSEGVWANGAILGGVLTHPGRLGLETTNAIAQSWRDVQSGAGNAAKIAVLEEGMKYEKIGVSPEDSELLDSRKFSVVELCRLFNVPPAVVGDFAESNFATSDAAMRFFATGCLAQWVAKLQAEFSRSVFNTPEAVLRIDLEGLLRGDFNAHATALINLTRTGIISQDEARHELGWNPRGGDADRLQAQAIGGRPTGADEGQGATSDPGGNLGDGLSNGSGRPTMQ